ncbi:hypothetical protein FQN54_001094 [Arachnomyces sp. PD_36]|nr:hypothetical protein FQN54_001094 [Arachnomyces sp. PD_36]
MALSSKPEASYASTRLTRSNYTGSGLLSQVNGRVRERTPKNYKIDSSSEEEGGSARRTRKPAAKKTEVPKKTEEPAKNEPGTEDEPLSSSDESDLSAINELLELSSTTRQSTIEEFKARQKDKDAAQTKKSQAANERETSKGATPNQPPRRGTRKSSRNGSAKVTSPKRPADEIVNAGFDDEDDELSFSQPIKRRKMTTYLGSSQKVKNIHTSGEFKQPSSPDVLNKEADSSSGFKDYGELPPRPIPTKEDSPGPKHSFMVPQDFDIPNPKATIPPPPKLEHGFQNTGKPTFHMPSAFDDNDEPIHSSQMGGGDGYKIPAALPNDTISSSSLTTSSSKNGAMFDFNLGDYGDDSPLSPLSSVESTCSQDLSEEQKAFLASDYQKPKKVKCPMCDELVEAEFLEEFKKEFSKGVRLGVRLQSMFCRRHRRKAAELEWLRKGYPTIKWDSFQDRIRGHFPVLEKFMAIDGRSKSFFRNAFDENIKNGGEAQLTYHGSGMEMMSAGYYGSKGSTRMLNAIISRYSSKIRRLASSDSLIKSTGVSGFAQAVLVPELTVLLIKEDMGIGDEAARQVMRESMEIGDRVNDDGSDVIKQREEIDIR